MLEQGAGHEAYFPQGVPAFYRIASGYRSAKAKGKSQ
jgi:hypothetical protein